MSIRPHRVVRRAAVAAATLGAMVCSAALASAAVSSPAVSSPPVSATTTHASGHRHAMTGGMMVMPLFGHRSVLSPARAAQLAATVDPSVRRPQAAAAAGSTIHHITLELLATDGATPDFTRAQALAGIAQLQAFYKRELNGAITLKVDAVLDWQSVDIPCKDWDSTFKYAKQRVNWVPGRDKHLVIMLPTTVNCDYGGIAGEGANIDSGESLITVGPDLGLTAHEFGHNISLFHAGTLVCPRRSDGVFVNGAWTNGCQVTEYGDRYDVMGAAEYNFDLDAASLARLRALTNLYRVPTSGTSQFSIVPISSAYGTRRVVTLVGTAGGAKIRYWIEARSTTGNAVFSPHPAAGDPLWPNAVRIIRADTSAPGHNLALSRPGDTSPTAQDFRKGDVARLADGTTVTVVALSAKGATVRIVRPKN